MGRPLFHVDAGLLESAASAVRESVGDQSRSPLRGVVSGEAAYGHAVLHHAMERFCGRWSDGLDLLHADARTIADVLERAAAIYRQVDQVSATELHADSADRLTGD